MKQLMWWVSAFILIMLLFNCGKEKPLPTGYSDIFGNKEGAIEDTMIVQEPGTEEFYSRLINTGAGSSLLLGQAANYHSAIYLKFEDWPDSAQFHSAKLYLTESVFDSNLASYSESFTANIYLAQYEWENDQDPEQYINQLPFMEQPYQSLTITPDTSMKIGIELDTLLIIQWADSTSGVTNYGLWIDSPDLDGINSYYAFETADAELVPQLELIYTYTDSVGSAILDTTTIFSKKDAFLFLNSEADLELDNNYFYAGKGFAFRSFLKFDLTDIDSTMHLNRALMELVINHSNSIRSASGSGDVRIYRMPEESWQKNEVNESPETSSYTGTLVDSTLTFDVTPTVQGWIGNNYPNYGFLVRSINENQTLARIAFYSSKANPDLQPRLYLYYTLPPKLEF